MKSGDTNLWARMHQPIDVRVADGALFAFKRLLSDWGYDKRAIQIDVDQHVLKIRDNTGASKEVLQTAVEDMELKIKWCDAQWEKWEELQSAPAFLQIIEKGKVKLAKAKEFGIKGTGKGKPASS